VGEVPGLELIVPAFLTMAVLAIGWLFRRRSALPAEAT
jgi:uncharacterized protein (TIGR03382 family)